MPISRWSTIYAFGTTPNQHRPNVLCQLGHYITYSWPRSCIWNVIHPQTLIYCFLSRIGNTTRVKVSCQSFHYFFSNLTVMTVGKRSWQCMFKKFNPLSPHDALKHHFTSLKTDLIFLQQRVLERKFPWNLIFKPHQIIFIHYKSRIATAIRGL